MHPIKQTWGMIMNLKFRILNTALMSLMLTFMMTLWITWINVGFIAEFFHVWMHAWIMAWPAAFICVMVLAQPVLLLSQKILKVK